MIVDNWRRSIEQDFDSHKMRMLDLAHEVILSLNKEECLQKFDLGAAEHDDASNLNPRISFREEMIDALNYSALYEASPSF